MIIKDFEPLTEREIKIYDCAVYENTMKIIEELENQYGKMEHLTNDNEGQWWVFFHGIKRFRDGLLSGIEIKRNEVK